jgi:hypothetical protein
MYLWNGETTVKSAAYLFATVCMNATAGLVDVSAIPKTHVSLSGRLPL